jgi:hypothetical protein
VPRNAEQTKPQLWKPHPDDEHNVKEAVLCADRGELLSPAESERFLLWLEEGGDEPWHDEFASQPGTGEPPSRT